MQSQMPDEPRNRAPSGDPPYRIYRGESKARSNSQERPYTVYRSAPRGLRSRLRGEDDVAVADQRPRRPRDDRGGPPREGWRRWFTPKRVLAYLCGAIVGWLLLSLALFLISASDSSSNLTPAALAELTPGGNMITSTDTVLILGIDQRPRTGPGSKEPGSNYNEAGSNSDTIMLWRIGGGTSRRLSIPRDTVANIPGHGLAKINAGFALGGPALALKTIENFTGLKINHVIIVNLAAFPPFVNAIGGVDVRTGRVCSNISGGTADGGFSLYLKPGVHHLNGLQALIYARTRENACNPADSDLTRVLHQQQILNAIRSKLLSPSTFFRLPIASWDAPKVLQTDMGGLTLLSLFAASEIGGNAPPVELKPTGAEALPGYGDALIASPGDVHRAVARLMNG
jgi:LCP family protein required for cell wall assembly